MYLWQLYSGSPILCFLFLTSGVIPLPQPVLEVRLFNLASLLHTHGPLLVTLTEQFTA